MKPISILSHPIIQFISFCVILIIGREWGAPYAWYVLFALRAGMTFSVLGVAGIVLTLVCIFVLRRYLQLPALFLMWASLIAFLSQLNLPNRLTVTMQPLALVTILFFSTITFFVIYKLKRWKNY
ncbi:MAG: hypothetical protein JWN76_428 [Chitinophagaceae bacterium]|nr:hypothetical protein [Chitinophagaceae bacterium]